MAAGRGQTVMSVTGGRELRRRLRTIEGGLADLKAAHAWVADYVGGIAARDAPRRTGRLAGTGRDSGTKTMSVVRFGRGASVPYAGPVHYGWPARHIAPNPWVINAAQRSEGVWQAYFEGRIEELVERTRGA
ncbi:hypothetical protein [Streptomyces sp. NPDC051546]|uniref:hypothetical protein n=1 Tax=Streptomyces sp. NPDC051546 TaxID=3365655 RepID=UPI0037BA5CC5